MNQVLLQAHLSAKEIEQLTQEFPQLIFLPFTENTYKQLPQDTWNQIEIMFGNRLTKSELEMAEHLRWIHSPTPDLSQLCLNTIEERGNILITTTSEENVPQIAEFVFAGVLAFSKNLFQWKSLDQNPQIVWSSDLRNHMGTLKDKIFLQIGLGTVGTEVAKRAKDAGMKVWGVKEQSSFHPACFQTFQKSDFPKLLPNADVICLTPSHNQENTLFFKKEDFEAMKKGAILFIRGSTQLFDEKALYEVAQHGKFRGIFFDVHFKTVLPPSSPLWKLPNILITPGVSPRPKSLKTQAGHAFRYNLRQFVHGNFRDMKNLYIQEDSIKL